MEVVGHIPSKYLKGDYGRIERTIGRGIGVELQISSDVMDTLTLKDFGIVRSLVGERTVTFHAPFLDLNPGAMDSYVLEATRRRFLELKPLVNMFTPKVIVFHTGFHPQKTPHAYDRWLERSVETFRLLCGELETKIALENVFEEDPKPIIDILERLPENAGVCIDVGHLNLFSSVPLDGWIEAFRSRIFEFHVHDNGGTTDDHLAIGKGNFDFDRFFTLIDSLNSDYILTLEAKRESEQVESLNYLKRRGKVEQGIGD